MKKRVFILVNGMLLFTLLRGITHGQNWTYMGTTGNSIASSADGTRLISSGNAWVGGSSVTRLSTNAGLSWSFSGFPASYVESSTNGKVLFIASSGYSGAGWISTNFGDSWQQVANGYYGGCAMSGNGKTLMTFPWSFNPNPPFDPQYSIILISTNTGASWWAASAPFSGWDCGAASVDGTQLLAGGVGGTYRSTNSGTSWYKLNTPAPNSSNTGNIDIACSSNGTTLIAIYGGNIFLPGLLQYPGFVRAVYTSTNSGASWVSNSLPVTNWNSVAVSDDGRTLLAVHGNFTTSQGTSSAGGVYTSTDRGATWVENVLTNTYFSSCAMAADGSRMFAVTAQGQVYVWPGVSSPAISLSDASLSLSWPTSAVSLVLQQSPDMSGTNWVDVTNTPTITDGQKVIDIEPSGLRGFFRFRQ